MSKSKMKVMAIYAHPADPVTDCGGTLALHVQNGDEVVAVSITHGGRIHPNMFAEQWREANPDQAILGSTREEVIAVKRKEMEAAAAILGIQKIITLEQEDNLVTSDPELVHRIAKVIAEEQPDVLIMDYPFDAMYVEAHSLITVMTMAALNEVGMYLENLDGKSHYKVKQIYMTKLPTTARSHFGGTNGIRNDLFIDITPVVGLKKKAMNCFKSQGYDGNFANKFIESHDGDRGRSAGVNFAEAYVRVYNETHSLLPLTDYARNRDALTVHRSYSTLSIRDYED